MRLSVWDGLVALLWALVVAGAAALRTDWAVFALVGGTVLAGVYVAWRLTGGAPGPESG